MTMTKKNECKECIKLRSLITSMLDKIGDIDAASGEAVYDLCQEVRKKIANGKANRNRQDGTRNPKNSKR